MLCLHDELLVHTPIGDADQVTTIVENTLQETAHRWQQLDRRSSVRFVADTSTVVRWSDAK